MRRVVRLGSIVSLFVLAFAASAQACTCAPSAPREALREADGAIVGELVEVVPRGRFLADYRYEVERVYRGARRIEVGRTLSVRSATTGPACGLPTKTGRRYGLFLARSGGRWRSGLCSVITPRRLAAAARNASSSAAAAAGRGGPCQGSSA